MRLIHDIPLPAFTSLLAEWGEPAYRAQQIWQGLYQHYYNSPAEFTNLPLSLHTNSAADTSKLEAEIDALVYMLYGLTEEMRM